jgi:hypothetical protein
MHKTIMTVRPVLDFPFGCDSMFVLRYGLSDMFDALAVLLVFYRTCAWLVQCPHVCPAVQIETETPLAAIQSAHVLHPADCIRNLVRVGDAQCP